MRLKYIGEMSQHIGSPLSKYHRTRRFLYFLHLAIFTPHEQDIEAIVVSLNLSCVIKALEPKSEV